MDCYGVAENDDYFEFIAEYSGVLEDVKEQMQTECVTVINNRFSIAYVPRRGMDLFRSGDYQYNAIPRCFGLMDLSVMEDAGVANEEIVLGENEYFVLGDNAVYSEDSRSEDIGMVSKDQIVGKVWFVGESFLSFHLL